EGRYEVPRLSARRIELGRLNELPAVGRDAKQGAGEIGCHDDRAVPAPGRAAKVLDRTKRLDATAVDRHGLELSAGDEAESAAVGRPEGQIGVGRPVERPRVERLECADPDF